MAPVWGYLKYQGGSDYRKFGLAGEDLERLLHMPSKLDICKSVYQKLHCTPVASRRELQAADGLLAADPAPLPRDGRRSCCIRSAVHGHV